MNSTSSPQCLHCDLTEEKPAATTATPTTAVSGLCRIPTPKSGIGKHPFMISFFLLYLPVQNFGFRFFFFVFFEFTPPRASRDLNFHNHHHVGPLLPTGPWISYVWRLTSSTKSALPCSFPGCDTLFQATSAATFTLPRIPSAGRLCTSSPAAAYRPTLRIFGIAVPWTAIPIPGTTHSHQTLSATMAPASRHLANQTQTLAWSLKRFSKLKLWWQC